MDTLNLLGTFLNIVAIAFAVVMVLIGIGLITAITMLAKKVKPSGRGTRPARRTTSPKPANRTNFRTRRKPV